MSSGADVLERGADRQTLPHAVPRHVRAAAVAFALALALLAGTQADLLSSPAGPAPPAPPGAAAADGVPRPVARDGHYFVTAAPGGAVRWLAEPTPLPPAAALLTVTGARSAAGGSTQVLLAAQDGQLFRADMRERRWLPLGEADRLVSSGRVPGRALVLRDGRLQEVEVGRGRTTDPAPFPGYGGRPWRARGVLSADDRAALVMTRDAADGSVELALAWPRGVTRVGQRPPREATGRVGAYLGVSGRWVLSLGRACPGAGCALQVLRMTADGPVVRTAAPPEGWEFVEGPVGGRPPRMLVPVRSLRSGRDAFAVLGGPPSRAVLVHGSGRVRQEAGLVPGPGGSVYLLSRRHGGDEVVVYDPAAAPVLTPVADLPPGMRLVCVCG